MAPETQRPLIIACAALTGDLRAVLAAGGLDDLVEIHYLPANLHNAPHKIVSELRPIVERAIGAGRSVFVAYADCGTGGLLDAFLVEYPGVERIAGAHCYEFFAGSPLFSALQEEELGTFYLTDFLAKHFDALVWSGLGLDRAPQLRDMYFGHYTRVMYLSQGNDRGVEDLARRAAERLGLAFEHRRVGRIGLEVAVKEWAVSIKGAVA